jgi:hypothetical protein
MAEEQTEDGTTVLHFSRVGSDVCGFGPTRPDGKKSTYKSLDFCFSFDKDPEKDTRVYVHDARQLIDWLYTSVPGTFFNAIVAEIGRRSRV